ncbi:Ankyrin repeat and SOCS box protein 18 [Labeo rohita]|uniref:Ankyrin repeat and SOCS box protein 18 n=1 Tax=Labeo rohita TaxID=84645 RepID=A0ABQ8MCN4_LABRO|nr:Ankyrin repeat and SOCS box protein 18 [Labeo rohita]
MSDDIVLDYPVESEFVKALKEAQSKEDSTCVQTLLIEASKENPNVIIELSNDDWMKDPDVELPPATGKKWKALSILAMLSQGSGACVVSRKATFLTERRRSSLEKSKGYKQPGMDFLCPPVLNDLLSHHWKDMQDGFSDPDQLNKVLEFQSDELLWTAQKQGKRMLRTMRFENLCSTVQLNGWQALPDDNCELGQDHWGRAHLRSLWLYRAVVKGDTRGLRNLLKRNYIDVDVFYNVSRDELEWQAHTDTTFGPSGLWSLEYKRELTSPLCIAAAQGFTECLQYLLEHGAHPNLIAGGKAALHEACVNANTECVDCAKTLVRYGAKVNIPSEEEDETPLHVAARHVLPHHAQLYLRFGACVNHSSYSGETPLGVVCGVAPEKTADCEDERYLEICRLFLAYGANINSADKERRSPLHKAARSVQLKLVELLLDNGADINAIDYNGCSPLSSVLQSSVVRHEWEPHRVLTACAGAPKTVEILFNSYTLVPVTSKWVEAIPEEIFHLHRTFYESLFALEYKPRSLQHLCRSALRKEFGKNCCLFISRLPVPKPLQRYLLLEPEGYID